MGGFHFGSRNHSVATGPLIRRFVHPIARRILDLCSSLLLARPRASDATSRIIVDL